MTKSKKYFFFGTIIFVIILALIAIDFSRRTVAPWEKDDIEISDE
ncbi:MAG: hypothetical protein AAF600_21730 [Bacteroidota bacterium]